MSIATSTNARVLNPTLERKIMSAADAAALIRSGDQIGMSGFTGSGYPKVVPIELAHRIADAHFRGQKFQVSVFTGASTGPELDGALAMAGGINLRLPYQSDPETRKRINAGEMDYMDIHLSHVAQFVEYGFLGKMDVALIEVTAVLEDGRLIPSSSIGNNKTWIDQAERVILEVNSWQPAALEGMHDIYYGLQPPPNRGPIPLVRTGQRIGTPYLELPAEKVAAIVLTDSPDRNSAFKAPDEASKRIAGHILEFLSWEVQKGRMPANLLPLQSGVGNIANAVLFGLEEGPFEELTSYTEVIQDGMIRLLKSGKNIGIGDGVLAESGDVQRSECRYGQLSGTDCAAAAGDFQPSGDHSAARCDRDERNDRGRHLWQRQLDARDGIADSERHRRLGRLCPQRIFIDLHSAVDCAEGDDLDDRAHGVARGPHRARCAGHRDGAGIGRSACTLTAAAGEAHYREVFECRVQTFAARLSGARGTAVVWETYATLADQISGLAQPVFTLRTHAPAGGKLAPNHEPVGCRDRVAHAFVRGRPRKCAIRVEPGSGRATTPHAWLRGTDECVRPYVDQRGHSQANVPAVSRA